MMNEHRRGQTFAESAVYASGGAAVPFFWYMADRADWTADEDPALIVKPVFSYRPLIEHPALFLEFAGLSGDPESFREFAFMYGPLTLYGDPAQGYEPDRLSHWRSEHQSMGEVLELLRLFQDGKVAISGRQRYQAAVADVVTAALDRHHVTPALMPNGVNYGAGVQIVFRVSSLIGGLWLQLAVAAEGNLKYGECFCGKKFEIADTPGRTREVCSARCRNRRHYLRRTGRWDEANSRPLEGGETNGQTSER